MTRVELVLSAPALPMAAAACIIFLIGWIALVRERVSTINISFFLLTASATVWLAATSLQMMSTSVAAAELWARVAYAGVCTIPASVLQFAFALIGRFEEKRDVIGITWIGSVIFATLFAFTHDFILGVWRYEWGYYTRLGIASVTFLVFFTAVLSISLVALGGAMRTDLTEQQKKRVTAFLVALAVGYLGSIDYLPSFGIDITPVGYVAVLACIGLCTRAIWRFSFADLTPAYLAEQLLENVQGGVVVVDTRGAVRVVNPAAADLLGFSADELIGSDLRELLRLERLPASDSQTFVNAGRTRNRTMIWRRRDGGTVEVAVSATRLRDRDQLPVGILYVLQDLSERRRAERHEFAANHDALTGLPNRTYLTRRFEQTVGEIGAVGRTAAVLFLDLDGFKEINDRHGHAVGDRLLQLVAARLRNAVREDDVLARYGGDEFVALMSLRSGDDAAIVSKKLTRVLRREPFKVDQLTLEISASVGVALAPQDGTEIDALVHAADEAMYRDKRVRKGTAAAEPEPRPRTDRPSAPPFAIESRA
ncbi:MAG TPA: diguanylate cyclase [Thermoanaerobaculia bacterium]|nr:diguanylate cyclase [Thermoanaerobaculia bacterium]